MWLRADASSTMGLGHLMRAMALAETALRTGLEVRLVTSEGQVARRLCERTGFSWMPVAGPRDFGWLTDVREGDGLIVDGYHFESQLLEAAVASGARTAVIDDLGAGSFPTDLVVNPSVAQGLQYHVGPEAQVLAGPRYAPIRGEFLAYRHERGGPPDCLLLTMGGSDIAELADSLTAELKDFVPLIVVQGPGSARQDSDKPGVSVYRDPPDVAAVFDRTGGAVSAAGSTTWELLAMGLPVILIEVSDNQSGVVRTATDAGAAVFGGKGRAAVSRIRAVVERLLDPAECRRLSLSGLDLVDGRGAERILHALLP